MASEPVHARDAAYLEVILAPLAVSREYKPKFGRRSGLTRSEFQQLYSSDHFYSWFGLDTPRIYAAHRTAGGMTSLYRQIGIGCERLLRCIFMDTLGLTEEQTSWSYRQRVSEQRTRRLSLDARLATVDLNGEGRRRVSDWLQIACERANVSSTVQEVMQGAVFEVRQGYKSKDSKRQNADLANAAAAYSNAYLPVLVLLSSQIDDDIAERYASANWLILRGTLAGDTTESTYEFFRRVVGYDLAGFFQRHSGKLRAEIEMLLGKLLD